MGAAPNPTPSPAMGAAPNPTPSPAMGAAPNPTPSPAMGAAPSPAREQPAARFPRTIRPPPHRPTSHRPPHRRLHRTPHPAGRVTGRWPPRLAGLRRLGRPCRRAHRRAGVRGLRAVGDRRDPGGGDLVRVRLPRGLARHPHRRSDQGGARTCPRAPPPPGLADRHGWQPDAGGHARAHPTPVRGARVGADSRRGPTPAGDPAGSGDGRRLGDPRRRRRHDRGTAGRASGFRRVAGAAGRRGSGGVHGRGAVRVRACGREGTGRGPARGCVAPAAAVHLGRIRTTRSRPARTA